MLIRPSTVAGLAAVIALSTGATVTAAPASPASSAPAVQRLVLVTRAVTAFAQPDGRAARLTVVGRRRPITDVQTALPVLARRNGADGRLWLQVMLPGRPNGLTGWISPAAPRYTSTAWRLQVDLAARRVTVIHAGQRVKTFRTVIGKASTPTPTGRFFVEESVALGPRRVGGPYALALSARSDVLQQFAGGPGQIALHGLDKVGGVPGTAVSHGCLRLKNRDITWLAARIVPGVPVTIR